MKKIIASIMSLMIIGAVSTALSTDNQITPQMYASAQSESETDTAIVGEWIYQEDDRAVAMIFRADGSIFMTDGESTVTGLYYTSEGKLFVYREDDDISDAESVEYRIEGDTLVLVIFNQEIKLKKYELPLNYELGDTNGDGEINAVDASHVLLIYALQSTGTGVELHPAQWEAADVNSDDVINAIDASIILSYYAYTATDGTDSLAEFIKK